MTETYFNTVSTLPTTNGQHTRIALSGCKICEAPARYSYFGAIVCQSCKMFFKRNAETKSILKCQHINQCNIDINNRHGCASCRLKKCFAVGMSIAMIRSTRPKKKEKNEKKKPIINLPTTTVTTSNNPNQFDQMQTSNLLISDPLRLTADEWSLLSNVIYCFDEYTGNLFVQHFIQDQNKLSLESQFEYSSVRDFFICMMNKIQIAFEKNLNPFSLCSHDRIFLLRTTLQYTTILGVIFTLRQHRLLDYSSFYNCAEIIFGPITLDFTKRVINQLDPDDTFIKLILTILGFSTIGYTVGTKNNLTKLTDTRKILFIQDMYADLAWRYLLYKYNHRGAVIRFSNLIRCLFHMNDAIVAAHESERYKNMIDAVIEKTEQSLCL